jgi:hypothetical protein
MRSFTSLFTFWTATAVLWPVSVVAQSSITVDQGWSNALGGTRLKLPMVVRSDRPLNGSLGWSLHVEQRVLAHGDVEVRTAAGAPKRVVLAIAIPPVRDEVVLKTQLTVKLTEPRQAELLASCIQPVWIFPQDPFSQRRDRLEELPISLFDPAGATIAYFEQSSIPFRHVRSQAALDGIDRGIVVIGEGASWRQNQGLSTALLRAAARGRPVLCLAPSDGDLSLGAWYESGGLPLPQSISFRQADIVHELDRRLDSQRWQGNRAVIHSLQLRGVGGEAMATVSEANDGWPWLEIQFPNDGSRLIVCGFGVIRHAQAGPAPRFLLSCLLERLMAQRAPTSVGK